MNIIRPTVSSVNIRRRPIVLSGAIVCARILCIKLGIMPLLYIVV